MRTARSWSTATRSATQPEDCGNRIGIDTGAFMTGRLTALVLEGTARRYIEAVEERGRTACASPPAARRIAAACEGLKVPGGL